jgi:hypothetical protein
MPAVVGGQIGPFVFIRVDGTINNVQNAPLLMNVTEPWEDGEVYEEIGRHNPIIELTAVIDLLHGWDIFPTLTLYRQTIGSYVTVQQRHGTSYANYNGLLVLDVQNVTPPERMHFTQTIGGINGGGIGGDSILFTTLWRLHYCLPI